MDQARAQRQSGDGIRGRRWTRSSRMAVAGLLAALVPSPVAAQAPDASPAGAPASVHQGGCPPSGQAPGTQVWRFVSPSDRAVEGAPAIAGDGTVYVATQNGLVHAVDCDGAARWTFDYAEHNAFGFRAQTFDAGPAVADDGTLFVGDGAGTPNFFFALNAVDGSPQWIHEEFGAASQFVAGPALSHAGHIYAGTTAATFGASAISDLAGSILVFDARGFLLPSYPVAVQGGVSGAPGVLADDRVVMVANGFTRLIARGIPTPTPFVLPPSLPPTRPPTGSPTPTAIVSPTPRIGPPTITPRGASPTATRTGPPVRVTPTPASDRRLYLPVAVGGGLAGDSFPSIGPTVSSVPPPRATPGLVPPRPTALPGGPLSPLQPTATALPTETPIATPTAHPIGPTATPFPRPTVSSVPPPMRPTPVPVTTEQVPPRLVVLGPSGPLASAEVGEGRASSVAVAGSVAVFQVQGTPPRLVAFDVSGPSPVRLWEHFMTGLVPDAPILGRKDAATGLVDLFYADSSARLVALAVPLRAGSGQLPRLRWARTLPAAALGAPVLGDAGVLYVGVGRVLRAFRTADGTDVWSQDVGENITGALQLGRGGTVYAGLAGGDLVAVATESNGLDPEALWPTTRGDARNTGRGRP